MEGVGKGLLLHFCLVCFQCDVLIKILHLYLVIGQHLECHFCKRGRIAAGQRETKASYPNPKLQKRRPKLIALEPPHNLTLWLLLAFLSSSQPAYEQFAWMDAVGFSFQTFCQTKFVLLPCAPNIFFILFFPVAGEREGCYFPESCYRI